jgi:hypothetical protein
VKAVFLLIPPKSRKKREPTTHFLRLSPVGIARQEAPMADRHDTRYKMLFSHPELVREVLESFVHEDFVRQLDWTRMTRIDKSFVNPQYRKKESDLIWQIPFSGKASGDSFSGKASGDSFSGKASGDSFSGKASGDSFSGKASGDSFSGKASGELLSGEAAGEPFYLYLLLEFQSTVDRFLALRMLHYLCEFYEYLNK